MSSDAFTLLDFAADFPDDSACLDWLWRHRHADDGTHAHCPRCLQVRQFRRYATSQQRQAWTCTGCGHHIHPTAGTLFHKSSTTLDRWFQAIYLLSATRGQVSARRLEAELGVTYKTAWRMKTLLMRELEPN